MLAGCRAFDALYRNLNRIFIKINLKTPRNPVSLCSSISLRFSVAFAFQYLGDYV